jgi:glycosyltransferase involved in cell wall biosynthesis
MRIGIDARNLIRPRTGIGRYIEQMVIHLQQLGHELVLYLPGPLHADYSLNDTGIRISNFPGPIARAVWGNTKLASAAAGSNLDVFWGPAHRLPGNLPASLPRVLTVHDLVWRDAPETMRLGGRIGEKLLFEPAVRRADVIATVSEATRQTLIAAFPKISAPVHTLYPAAYRSGGVAAPSLDRPRFGIDRPYALFVGTPEPRKNLDRALAAYAKLGAPVRARCMLVLAGGDGWGAGGLPQQVTSLNLKGDVRLAGKVSEADLNALYAHARFLFMPSLLEGFGLPIIEAHGYGVPVLTSNTSSMPEAAGEGGLLVDPKSIDAIADGFHNLAMDDVLHSRLASQSKANASRFDWSRSAVRLTELFALAQSLRKAGRP